MTSVMRLLEGRERDARQRVDALQSELREAEAVWERFVITRETVAEVLAEPCGGQGVPPVVVVGEGLAQAVGAVRGSVVPVWREGLVAEALAPDYQQLIDARTRESGSRDGPCCSHNPGLLCRPGPSVRGDEAGNPVAGRRRRQW
ncbi:hypothetical protein ACFYVL_00020 [Streptomyces sp. NPDC004111]|uniref:hypothetical protein n=1 Tax=Streptomyces sp. NPDC004111 TaxID=3364690 RepID=UPI00367FFB73